MQDPKRAAVQQRLIADADGSCTVDWILFTCHVCNLAYQTCSVRLVVFDAESFHVIYQCPSFRYLKAVYLPFLAKNTLHTQEPESLDFVKLPCQVLPRIWSIFIARRFSLERTLRFDS